MHTKGESAVSTVTAAQAGDQQALEALVETSLPLVYNIVGRALEGHADVDDVVQETMLRVVNHLSDLRDPERYRSWLVAIAMRQVRERWRLRQARPLAELPDEAADPGADFVDLSILRLGLSGQRREVAEATRWLEPEERQLLSLWWLEASGELTRAELAAASELTPQHAAVRVQRMKARLDSARAVVRALRTRPGCAELQSAAADWNGAPSALWRKRLARHTRECPNCAGHWVNLLPAEGLLVGLALVPPVGLAVSAVLAAAGSASNGAPVAVGLMDRVVQAAQGLWAKPVALAAAGAVTAAGGAAVLYPVTREPQAVPRPSPTAAITATASTTPRPQSSATPTRPLTPTPSAISTPRFRYGQTVDVADAAPPRTKRPGALPTRREGPAVTMTGVYDVRSGDGGYVLAHRGEHLTITGRGYFRIRWQVMFTERPGHLQLPSWTGLDGKLFHVASGGGHRLDDQHPDQPGHSWMGNPTEGYAVLPPGAQQMWQNEFYYVDGSITLHQNETGADYNLQLLPVRRTELIDDLNQSPSEPHPLRYGVVRDTGRDDAPVPQYLTRATPAEPRSVPQRSEVS